MIKSPKLAETQSDFGGKVVTSREPDTNTCETRRWWLAVDQTSKHGGYADKDSHPVAFQQVQC